MVKGIIEKVKRNYLFYILLVFLVFTACKEEREEYAVDGNITNLSNDNLYIVSQSDSGMKIDTIRATEGHFQYTSVSDSTTSNLIYMEEGKVWITIWAKNKEQIKIAGDANYPELIEVRGSEINNLLTEFKFQNKDIIKERCDLKDAKNPDNSARINTIDQLLREKAEGFIKKHPFSLASLVLIQDYLVDNNQGKVDQYLSLIEGEVRNDSLYKRLSMITEKYNRTIVGNPAPDFSLITTKDDTISLETFKDKYLLLTFEASWCPVCKDDYKALVEIRKKYPKKRYKLEMLTIALDKDVEDWEKVVKDEKLDWYQVIDNNGLASEMLSLYNVSTISNNFLIDKEGIILAKDISTDSIKTLLKEHVKIK